MKKYIEQKNKELKLYVLKGTEAQKKWANQIRMDFIYRESFKDYSDNITEEKKQEILKTERTAKFWIENRNNLI